MSSPTYVIAFVHTFDDAPELGRVLIAHTQEKALELARDMIRNEYVELLTHGEQVVESTDMNLVDNNIATITDDDLLSSEGYRSEDGWSVCIGIAEDE